MRKKLKKYANWRKRFGRVLTTLIILLALFGVVFKPSERPVQNSDPGQPKIVQSSPSNQWIDIVAGLDACRNHAFRNLDEQALAKCVAIDSAQYKSDLAALSELAADHLKLSAESLRISQISEIGSRWSESGEFVVLKVIDCLQLGEDLCEENREWLVTLEKNETGWLLWETKLKVS